MRHITSCSGQRVALSDDHDGPTRPHPQQETNAPGTKRTRAPAPTNASHTVSLNLRLSPPDAALALLCATYDLMECHTTRHRSRGPGGRRMECLTVVLPHHCPCGQATTAYPLRSGHEVCRIGTPPAAYFLSPSSMLRRQSRQSHQSRQSPIIHARRASNGHGQPPPPAPVQLWQSPRARGAAPPHP